MDNNPKLLIVEDDFRYADLIVGCMQNHGWETTVVGTLRECVSLLPNGFNAITLDLRLPDTIGNEGLTKVRAVARELPIVVVSGFITEHEYAALIAMGADVCIQKPPQVDIVAKAVQRAIKLRDSRGALDELYRAHDNLRKG